MKKLLFAVVASLLFLPFLTSPAGAIPVQYTGVYGENVSISGNWYTGGVVAGIYKLIVDGNAVDSFCIDLANYANTSRLEYGIAPLSNAPQESLGPMGSDKASAISRLWDMAYSPTMSTSQAAALQVAIWEVLVDSVYNLSTGGFWVSAGSADTMARAQTLLAGLGGHTGSANLVALTHPTAQDYVAQVPEPATMLLLGAGLIGLAGFGRKKLLRK